MQSKDKIQYLLITHLLETGFIKLNLPNEMHLEISILKEGKKGHLEKHDDYCSVQVNYKDRELSLDSFNLNLKFDDTKDNIIFEDAYIEEGGKAVKEFSIC